MGLESTKVSYGRRLMGRNALATTRRRYFRVLSGVVLLGLMFAASPAQGEGDDCSITRADEFDRLLDQGKTKIFFVKYEDALAKLQRAETSLPCIQDPLGRVSLGRLFLYKGVALFFLDKTVEARAAFEQAIVLDRRVKWDEQFGDLPKELYLEAKEAVIEYPKGSIRIPTDMKAGTAVYVDGDMHESGTVAEGLPVGYHFVQVVQDEKVVKGMMFNVQANKQLTVPVPPTVLKQREPFDKQKLRPVSYVALGVGALALAGGTGAGVVTWLTQKDLKENYYANRDDEDKDALLARQKTMAYVADACFGAAVVFGGAGAVMYLASGQPTPGDIYAKAPVTTFRLGRTRVHGRWYPWAAPGATGLAVSGSF